MWLITGMAIALSAFQGTVDQDPRVDVLVEAVRTTIAGIAYSGMGEQGLVIDTAHVVYGDGPQDRGGRVAADLVRDLGARGGALESLCVPTHFGEGRAPMRGAAAVVRATIVRLETGRAEVRVSVIRAGDSGFGFGRTYEMQPATDGWQVDRILSRESGGCPVLPPR